MVMGVAALWRTSRWYLLLLWSALLWALGNCAYVYLVAGPAKAYRIESAAIVLVGLLIPTVLLGADGGRQPLNLSARTHLALATLAIVAWAVLYIPLLNFPFLSDDYVFLDLYRAPGDLIRAPQFFRPLFATLFWVLDQTGGHAAWVFHATSVALHITSSYFVYTLCARLALGTGPALLCGIVFLLNPLQLEAVLWVSGLQELLWTFFILAACTVYSGAVVLTPVRLATTVGLVALALLSKETAVCYVVLLPALAWIAPGGPKDPPLREGRQGVPVRWAYALFAVELIAYLTLRQQVVAMEATYFIEPSRFFAKQFLTLPYKFFTQPWNVAVVDVPSIVLLISSVSTLCLLFWAAAVRRLSHHLLWGAFIVIASTLPLYGYFFVREDLLSARYLYFPSFGWGVIVATMGAAAIRSPRVLMTVAVALVIGLAVSLRINLRPWLVAAEVVNVMTEGLAADGTPDGRLKEWLQENGVRLSFRGSVPYEYGGVGIFINGYDGFVRHALRHR